MTLEAFIKHNKGILKQINHGEEVLNYLEELKNLRVELERNSKELDVTRKALETMCKRCINHEQCMGTGCSPKQEIKSAIINIWREYGLRKPYPNKYKHTIDNGHSMLECPECESRITSAPFSYAVGDYGYKYCPYCGADVRRVREENE